MNTNRREFIALAIASAAISCEGREKPVSATSASIPAERMADAGPLADFAADGVFDAHRHEGFFIVRRDKTLFAISSVCTHKGCKVRAQQDQSFACKCHGSTFDKDGKVTKGPAKQDLPRLSVAVNERQHLIVKLG